MLATGFNIVSTLSLTANQRSSANTKHDTLTQCLFNPLSPHDAKSIILHPCKQTSSPTTRGLIMKIYMKLVYQYMAIFFNFPPTSNRLHPLQVENCDSNSRLVVDEDDNGKFRLERVNIVPT